MVSYIVLLAICLATIHYVIGCPAGWSEYTGQCYWASLESRNFTDAQINCEAMAANLTSISDLQENEFVQQLCRSSISILVTKPEGCWIGLARWGVFLFDYQFWVADRRERGWKWLDGQPYDWRTNWYNDTEDVMSEPEPYENVTWINVYSGAWWAAEAPGPETLPKVELPYVCKKDDIIMSDKMSTSSTSEFSSASVETTATSHLLSTTSVAVLAERTQNALALVLVILIPLLGWILFYIAFRCTRRTKLGYNTDAEWTPSRNSYLLRLYHKIA